MSGDLQPRSILRVRERQHHHPDRQNEVIIEVIRDGEVVATIYGSREGIHVVSDLFTTRKNRPFSLFGPGMGQPGIVLPLLQPNEKCPWCEDEGYIGPGVTCPCCGGPK